MIDRDPPWAYVRSGDTYVQWQPYPEANGILIGGEIVVVPRLQADQRTQYAEPWIYVINEDGRTGAWKQVDLNWPKIDPRTGEPWDQFLEWYSPLA